MADSLRSWLEGAERQQKADQYLEKATALEYDHKELIDTYKNTKKRLNTKRPLMNRTSTSPGE